ncbi:hypothetical protein KSC_058960 [Ktedonobacter sp. SOSP1-52]|nr:hypothetical protein KSC_058960 [Ktedonobacter sp. SOSP1-52]
MARKGSVGGEYNNRYRWVRGQPTALRPVVKQIEGTLSASGKQTASNIVEATITRASGGSARGTRS